jgi:serine protease Do
VVSLAPQEVKNDGVLGIRLRNGDPGPIIIDVIEESAAAAAGLVGGDMVLRINEETIRSSDALVRIVGRRLPGDEVQLLIRRQDEEMTLKATLGRRADLDLENSDFQSFLGGELSARRSGFPSVLQHDTFLMPQHCGGPIVDLEGRVVGINIARAERIASYALTSDEIEPWVNQFRDQREKTVVAGVSRTGGGGGD